MLEHDVIKQPKFLSEMQNYPNMDPILISVDWNCVNYVRRLNGVCLLCNHFNQSYDLTISFNKESWILYSNPQQINQALSLARNAQLAGATKVAVLQIKLRENKNDNVNKATYYHRAAVN